jgi:O-antigen biosynthesis protein
MNHPAARARINRRVTGDPARWPIAWLPSVVPDRVPFARALSIGCGVGNFERSLIDLGIVGEVTGIDASAEVLEAARCSAEGAGMAGRIRYVHADAREFVAAARGMDAVFFHASLHHFDRLGELLADVRRALAPRGVLYLDEYVGPARDEWTWRHLLAWNAAYRALPARVRRTRIVRRPINAEDPTEAIASSGILPAVAGLFRVLARRDYGGNLLEPIYPSLLRPNQPGGPQPELFDAAVEELLAREDRLLARGRAGYFSVVVAEAGPGEDG